MMTLVLLLAGLAVVFGAATMRSQRRSLTEISATLAGLHAELARLEAERTALDLERRALRAARRRATAPKPFVGGHGVPLMWRIDGEKPPQGPPNEKFKAGWPI